MKGVCDVRLQWAAGRYSVDEYGPGHESKRTQYTVAGDAANAVGRAVLAMIEAKGRGRVVIEPAPLSALHVEIPGILLTNANNSREHEMVRSRRVKAQRHQASLVMASAGVHRLKLPLRVTITRVAPRLAKDTDNLPVYGKVIRDEIARMLGVDDADLGRVPPIEWSVTQIKGKEPKVLVVLEEMPAPPGSEYKRAALGGKSK